MRMILVVAWLSVVLWLASGRSLAQAAHVIMENVR